MSNNIVKKRRDEREENLRIKRVCSITRKEYERTLEAKKKKKNIYPEKTSSLRFLYAYITHMKMHELKKGGKKYRIVIIIFFGVEARLRTVLKQRHQDKARQTREREMEILHSCTKNLVDVSAPLSFILEIKK